MCDYSLHQVASRPAKVGDELVTTRFARSTTRGFAAVGSQMLLCVCFLEVRASPEFPGGDVVLLTRLIEGQRATVRNSQPLPA